MDCVSGGGEGEGGVHQVAVGAVPGQPGQGGACGINKNSISSIPAARIEKIITKIAKRTRSSTNFETASKM